MGYFSLQRLQKFNSSPGQDVDPIALILVFSALIAKMNTNDSFIPILRCGKCMSKLSNMPIIFTTCGHFYCAPSSSTSSTNCTSLRPQMSRVRCEQCNQICDVSSTCNVDRLPKHIQCLLSMDIRAELKKIDEIIEFRQKHYNILDDNADAQERDFQCIKELEKENSNLQAKLEELDIKYAENENRLTSDIQKAEADRHKYRKQVTQLQYLQQNRNINLATHPNTQIASTAYCHERQNPNRNTAQEHTRNRFRDTATSVVGTQPMHLRFPKGNGGQDTIKPGRLTTTAMDILRSGRSLSKPGHVHNHERRVPAHANTRGHAFLRDEQPAPEDQLFVLPRPTLTPALLRESIIRCSTKAGKSVPDEAVNGRL